MSATEVNDWQHRREDHWVVQTASVNRRRPRERKYLIFSLKKKKTWSDFRYRSSENSKQFNKNKSSRIALLKAEAAAEAGRQAGERVSLGSPGLIHLVGWCVAAAIGADGTSGTSIATSAGGTGQGDPWGGGGGSDAAAGTWDSPRLCPLCARVYSNNSNLRRHLRSAHARATNLLELTSLQRKPPLPSLPLPPPPPPPPPPLQPLTLIDHKMMTTTLLDHQYKPTTFSPSVKHEIYNQLPGT